MEKYRVREHDGRAVIVDEIGCSIVNIHTTQDKFGKGGTFYSTPTFDPELANRIVKALALADAIVAMSAA